MEAASVFTPVGAKRESGSDLDVLQGAWISVFGNREMELLVTGNHYAIRFRDGQAIYMGTFTADTASHPKCINMTVDAGPDQHVGKTIRCIYALEDGETLRWCPTPPGLKKALVDFPDETDDKYLYTVFRRDWP